MAMKPHGTDSSTTIHGHGLRGVLHTLRRLTIKTGFTVLYLNLCSM